MDDAATPLPLLSDDPPEDDALDPALVATPAGAASGLFPGSYLGRRSWPLQRPEPEGDAGASPPGPKWSQSRQGTGTGPSNGIDGTPDPAPGGATGCLSHREQPKPTRTPVLRGLCAARGFILKGKAGALHCDVVESFGDADVSDTKHVLGLRCTRGFLQEECVRTALRDRVQ